MTIISNKDMISNLTSREAFPQIRSRLVGGTLKARYGFSLDLIAASFGMRDPGWALAFPVAPRRLIQRSRMERLIEQWIIYGPPNADLPSLVEVNLGSGPALYDARVVRAFVTQSELFKQTKGALVRVERYNRRDYLSTIELDPGKLEEDKKILLVNPSGKDAPGRAGTPDWDAGAIAGEGESGPEPEGNQALGEPTYLNYFRLGSDREYRVRLLAMQSCNDPWKGVEKLKDFPAGCMIMLRLTLGPSADAYRVVGITGRISGSTSLKCDPPDWTAPEKGVDRTACEAPPQPPSFAAFGWSIDPQEFLVHKWEKDAYLKLAASPAAARVRVRLRGTRVSTAEDHAFWCWPNKCEPDIAKDDNWR